MSDGDIVPCGFGARFRKPYKKLVVDDFDPKVTADAVALAGKHTMIGIGDGPLKFICDCVDSVLSPLVSSNLDQSSVNYGELSRRIDKFALNYPGNIRGLELAKKAIKHELLDHRNSGSDFSKQRIIARYGMNICESEYIQRVPLAREHWNNQDHATVNSRLHKTVPYIQQHMERFGRQALARGTVSKLRVRRLAPRAVPNVEDDLF